MEEYYYQLIELYYKKTISTEELLKLRLWVESSESNQSKFREVLRVLEASEIYLQQPIAPSKSWAIVANHIQQPVTPSAIEPQRRKLGKWQWYAIAALIVVVSTISLLFFEAKQPKPSQQQLVKVISNAYGEQRSITMPDGSVIYLNAGSRISYNEGFTAQKRMVKLEGEAFFDVVHETNRPFIVQTGKVSTTVLGTSFNIKAFKARPVEVTVETGKVGVVFKKANHKDEVNFLLPNEQLLIDPDKGEVVKRTVNAADVSAWKHYRLVFYNTSLQEITATIERAYNVKIDFKEAKTANLKLTAKFDKCGIKEIMDVLSKLSGSTYQIKENKITIY